MSEFYNNNPKSFSQKAIKEAKKAEARKNIGLTENFVDIKDSSKDPTLAYV